MWINNIILAFVGSAAGFIIASGVFAFIAIIGVIPKMVHRTNTIQFTRLYEDFIILGGILGNTMNVYHFNIPIGEIATAMIGLLAGIFIGCVILSLAETLDAIPIFTRRIRLTQGLSAIVLFFAIGKTIGSLIYFYIFKN